MQAAKGAADRVTGAAASGASVLAGVLPDAVKGGAVVVASAGKDAVEKRAKEVRDLLEAWTKRKIQKILESLVDKIPGIVKNSLEDPDMPRPVARAKDSTVDIVWPDVRDEIMWEVAVLLDGAPAAEEEDFGAACCCCRFLRYHLFPNDKSFWGKLRDPVFVIFTLVSLIPVTGLCPIIYLFIFSIIDRGDEYQLIQFILQFKGTQFLSHGIIRTLVGFFTYVGCVTAEASEVRHRCKESGPGIAGRIEVVLGGWVLQVVLVWLAFCFLPCSRDKGRSELAGKVEFVQTAHLKRQGGALVYFLLWDMLSFLACSAVLVWVATTRPTSFHHAYRDWAFKHTFYACQITYGFLSMPFFFFTLPVLNVVLTHSVPTAYNRNGVCCKFQSPERKRDAKSRAEIVSEQECNSIMERVKVIFFGSKADPEA